MFNMKKICVYAICKNEEQFVDRWFESIKDADGIFVLDTGSTDNTVDKLKSHNITVKEKVINPWRFDVARNESLNMIPEDFDICICLDLDEVIDAGWKEKLLKVFDDDTDRLRYVYNWKIDEDGTPKVTYYADKIHKRMGFRWKNPVHEILEYKQVERQKFTDEITVNHYPDTSKSRSSYLPLLELSVKENPNDDRNVHYLGREYMYYGRWNEAIDTLIKHLNLPTSTWKDERCASMRFIARSYKALKRYDEAKMWIEKAMMEAPYLKDPFAEACILYYDLKDYKNAIKYGEMVKSITDDQKTYMNEIFSRDETIPDILSICYYYEKNIDLAIKNAEEALAINPKNKRIKDNLKIFKESKRVA